MKGKNWIGAEMFSIYIISITIPIQQMLSGESDFPSDELLNCLRNKGQDKEQFLQEVCNLNIQWIYEIIKYCHNLLSDAKESPETKLTGLELIKDMIETCEVPCMHLLEVYILPVIYEFAIYKPNQKKQQRGRNFFQNGGKTGNREQIGIDFITLCTQMLYVCSIIKTNRTFENQKLSQVSDYAEYYQKFCKYQIDGTPKSISHLTYFKERSVRGYREKYEEKLAAFEENCQEYSEYFVNKIINSLQTEENVLFANPGKAIISLNTDLDMRKLLKYGDTYVTSPLLQQLSEGLKSADDFSVKRNYLALLTDFVKWADIESFVQICYDDILDIIALKISEVSGDKGIQQGDKIYPEIKGQKEGKKKFYVEFLKSLEVWAKCIDTNLDDDEEESKVKQLYYFFKGERKFVFPENLMAKRIEAEFAKCQEYNSQRNQKILAKLRMDQTSLINTKKSSSINRAALAKSSIAKPKTNKITFETINQNFENCFDNFVTLCDEEKTIHKKMKILLQFKENFDDDLNEVEEDQSERSFSEFEQLLDNGDELIGKIELVQPLYEKFKKKQIAFEEFQEQFQQILDTMEEPNDESASIQSSKYRSFRREASLSVSKTRRSQNKKVKESDQVISSFNLVIPSDIVASENKKQLSSYAKMTVREPSEQGSTLSQKLKIRRESRIKKETGKQSGLEKNSVKNENSKIEGLESHPYYGQQSLSCSKRRASRLGKKEKSYIHASAKSGLSKKLSKRRSQMSLQSCKKSNFEDSPVQNCSNNNNNSCSEYLINPEPSSAKKSIRDRIESHRSSRISLSKNGKSSNLQEQKQAQEQNYYSIAGASQSQFSNLIHDQKVIEVSHSKQSFSRYSQKSGMGSQMQEKSSRLSRKSNFSRKSGLRQKIEKSKSNLKMSRNSSKSWMKSENKISGFSKEEDKDCKSKRNDDYMIASSKSSKMPDANPRSSMPSQISCKRPASSRLKSKLQSHQSSISRRDRQVNQILTNTENYFPAKQQADHYQIRGPISEEDRIQIPQGKPSQNSYYGMEQIEARAQKNSKAQFKECFEIKGQEVITVGGRRPTLLTGTKRDEDLLRKKKIVSVSGTSGLEPNVNKNPQEEYFMMKLQRQHEKEQNEELKKMQGRILKLKNETSKIRTELSSRSQDNKEFSVSRRSYSGASSRDHCSFSLSNRSRDASLSKDRSVRSIASRSSLLNIEGRLLNLENFSRYFDEIKDEQAKKIFLKQKSILLKNDLIEVGCLFRRQKYSLKIMLFICPEVDVSNFTISTSKEYNVDIKAFPENFSEIPAKKQIKATLIVEVKNAPYNIPTMTISFKKGREQKNYNLPVPCSLHRFLEFKTIHDQEELLKKFQSQEQSIMKTEEFKINRKVGKIENLLDYFPHLVTVMKGLDVTKYAAQCTFKNEHFLLMFTTRSSGSMIIQGIPLTRPEFLEYFMGFLMHTLTIVR